MSYLRVAATPAAPGPNPPPRKCQRDGAKFVCDDPATWPAPAAVLRCADAVYGDVDVRAWTGLHTAVRAPPPAGRYRPRLHAHGTVLRRRVARLPGHQRTPEVIWLCYQGPRGQNAPTARDLDRLWRAYCRRYDLEQTFGRPKGRRSAPAARYPPVKKPTTTA